MSDTKSNTSEGGGGSTKMDEQEFKHLLDLFPIVRSRDYNADDSSQQSTPQSSRDVTLKEWHDAWDQGDQKGYEDLTKDKQNAFWEKLKSAAERKVGTAQAERFCRAFQQVHRKLVYEELTLDAAQKFINSSQNKS